jgi:hypothetical protein
MAIHEATTKRGQQNPTYNVLSPIMNVGSSWPPQKVSVLVVCAGCGRGFVPTGPQRYCSHDCYSGALRVPIEQRFWTKVNKTSTCWLWTAATIRGYGQIAAVIDGKRRPAYAHRQSWEMANGPITDGLEVLHRCDVPLCVRPDHLFLGSQADNLADARQKGRLDESRPRTRILTPDDRMAIYSAAGYRGVVIDLARQYGVTKTCISLIRKGRFKRQSQPLSLARPFDPSRHSVHTVHSSHPFSLCVVR